MLDLDFDDNPKERREAYEEFVDLAEAVQIAEGDISISETSNNHQALPDLDDDEVLDEVWGEDDLIVLDENDPRLGLSFDEEDSYLDED